MNRSLAAACLVTWTLAATAGPMPPTARAEVIELLTRLEVSGCQFNRNGTWYPGSAAKDHLAQKLQYIETNGNVSSAENFIQIAAAASSASGKPYLVRCGASAPVTSTVWLTQQLRLIRNPQNQSSPK